MATGVKKSSHIFWVCPDSDSFFRVKGEVKCRPSSVIPKLIENGLRVTVLIPYDPALLPKSKLSQSRVIPHTVSLSQGYPVEFVKLTRAQVMPSIYMLKTPHLEPGIRSAVLAKSALGLAKILKTPVDVFHAFGWEASLLPLFLEMEKENGNEPVLQKTKTFLNIDNIKELGSFSPEILKFLSISENLFHPEAMEFYGQVSFLKTGLLFADGVGMVETGNFNAGPDFTAANGIGGLLNFVAPKLRRWASPRSFKAHIEAYQELLSHPKTAPLLPTLMKKIHSTPAAVEAFRMSWGPLPPHRYNVRMLSFLIQSPVKGFALWEWSNNEHRELGLLLEDKTSGVRSLLSRGLDEVGDYWIELIPDHYYAVELVGWTHSGEMQTLLRTRVVRTPRNLPSSNKNAVFIDVRSRRRFGMSGYLSWDDLSRFYGSSIGFSKGFKGAAEFNFPINVPSSWRQKVLV